VHGARMTPVRVGAHLGPTGRLRAAETDRETAPGCCKGPCRNNLTGSASRRPAGADRATRNAGGISRRAGGSGGDAPAAKRIGYSCAGPKGPIGNNWIGSASRRPQRSDASTPGVVAAGLGVPGARGSGERGT
jgi:hypothetical protein